MSTFVLMYFFLYFCKLFGLSIRTSMQNLEAVAQKMAELLHQVRKRTFIYYYILYIISSVDNTVQTLKFVSSKVWTIFGMILPADVFIHVLRHVIVDDVSYSLDARAAGHYIIGHYSCPHENLYPPGLEIVKGFL